ncbi:MAG: 4'-phosphopantetheinyl transferase superfamily protein [Pseudomonadota bacterium]
MSKYTVQSVLEGFFTPIAAVQVADIDAYPIPEPEQDIVSGAVQRRQQEFSSGRWCARQALKMLNIYCPYIGVGELHQPLWPQGVIATISHDINLSVAVVIPEAEVPWMNIGVDLINLSAEKNTLTGLAYLFIYNEDELQLVATLTERVQSEMVLFSLKECAVKALSKVSGKFIDLRELRFLKVDKQFYCHYLEMKYCCEILVKETESFLVTAIKVYPPQADH